MILLDESQQIIHDEDTDPDEGIKKTFISRNAMCFRVSDDVFHHFYLDGSLSFYSLSKSKFKTVILSGLGLDFFCKEGQVVAKDAVVRDVGCEYSMICMEECSFHVSTELLHR